MAVALVLVACSDEPSSIAIADDPTTTLAESTAAGTDDGIEETPESTAPSSLPTTTAPTSTTDEATPSDSSSTSTSTTPNSTTEPLAPEELAAEPLGDFLIEGYELVWLHDRNEETECQKGTLAVQADDGTITHTYDDLGPVGGMQVHYGVRGAIALVEFCEEFVQAIHFANVAVPPADNVPDFLTTTPPSHVFSLFDMGFSNAGWFIAEATLYEDGAEGWNEIVVFDASDGSMTELADLVGDRTDHFAFDLDFVIPDEWSAKAVGPNRDWIRLDLPNDSTHVQIEHHDAGYDQPPLAAGEELVNTFDSEQSVWERLGNGRSRRVQIVPSTEYVISSDDGERYVEVVTVGDSVVVIERFVGANAPSWAYETPYLATELVRIYDGLG